MSCAGDPHSVQDVDWIAPELKDRPRKRLGSRKPIEQIGTLLMR
jgi:transposase, IS30 family